MMHIDDELVSLLDFVETTCKIDNDSSASTIINEFCNILTSKYSFESNRCYKAEASDKTRHVILPISIILKIFITDNMRKFINQEALLQNLKIVLAKSYIVSNTLCCCCPKKLKKAVSHASAFNLFVKKGDVELRRFNNLKKNIKLLISLDIEGNICCFVNASFIKFTSI